MTQQGLFSRPVAERAKENAIDRVERNADDAWMAAAIAAVRYVASSNDELTSDDVWNLVDHLPEPHEPRAMGAAFRRSRRNGWIEPTDRTKCSKRPRCHGRPIRIWRSLLVEAAE